MPHSRPLTFDTTIHTPSGMRSLASLARAMRDQQSAASAAMWGAFDNLAAAAEREAANMEAEG